MSVTQNKQQQQRKVLQARRRPTKQYMRAMAQVQKTQMAIVTAAVAAAAAQKIAQDANEQKAKQLADAAEIAKQKKEREAKRNAERKANVYHGGHSGEELNKERQKRRRQEHIFIVFIVVGVPFAIFLLLGILHLRNKLQRR